MKTIKNIVDQNYSETFWPRVGFSFLLEILQSFLIEKPWSFQQFPPKVLERKVSNVLK